MKTLLVKAEEHPIAVIPDITYSQVTTSMHDINRPLKLSIILPLTVRRAPVILWLEGGGWRTLNPQYALGELAYFAKKGYAVASLQYRVSSEGTFPLQLIDVKAGIRYLRANSDRLGLDTEKIGIMGRSSGGHLAVLAGLTNGAPQFEKGEWLEQSSQVHAVADLYGTMDLIGHYQWLKALKKNSLAINVDVLIGENGENHPELLRRASPTAYVSPQAPPHLILHGDRDNVVPLEQSRMLYEALTKEQVPAEFYILEGAGHGTAEFEQQEIKALICEFFNKNLKIETLPKVQSNELVR